MEKTSRRAFLRNAALACTATTIPNSLQDLYRPMKHLGVQLWSVRDDMNKNPAGTLEAIAGMGYKEVEAFGYNDGKMFGLSTTAYVKALKNNGLKMPSAHCGFSIADYSEAGGLSDKAKKAIDAAASMGQKYIIYPWVPDAERKEVKKITQVAAAAAQYAQKAGIKFGYHNHDFEFIQRGPDGRLLMEWLLQEIDPKLISFEMDLYWVCYANQKPTEWFKRFPGRWHLCHAKDMAKTEKRETVEFGDGSIDFVSIFRQSKLAGLKYYIIELEHYKTTPMQGIGRARKNLVGLDW
ncbi:MAG: sugar phosphate isomerase/epimerase [Chitinophagales bacterium]|nr:sugar phosphate isomerase/epimerase [Chitinophagales bacterium]